MTMENSGKFIVSVFIKSTNDLRKITHFRGSGWAG